VVNKPTEPFLVKDKTIVTGSVEPVEMLRFGFMKREIKVPDDFDRMGKEVIAELFTINNAPVR